MSWEANALCSTVDPNLFFPQTVAIERRAKAVCFGCAVRNECLAEALGKDMEFGVWGGTNERERRALRRRFPGERDWNARLTAMDARVPA